MTPGVLEDHDGGMGLSATKVRRSYLRNVFGLTLIQGLNLLVPVLLIPLIVNVQGLEAYGHYAAVLAYYFFAGVICDYGFEYSSVRALRQGRENSAERRRIVAGTFSAKWLLFAAAGPACWVAITLFGGIRDPLLILAGMLVPLSSVVSVHWLYLAEGRLIRLIIPIGIARLSTLAAVLVIYPHWPSTALVMVLATGPVLLVHAAFWVREVRHLEGPRWFTLEEGFRAIRSGSTAFYINFISSYLAMSSILAVSAFVSAREIGLFAAIERLARAVFGVAKPFLAALYPEMSTLFHEAKPQWRAIVKRVSVLACLIGASSLIAVTVAWQGLSVLFFGEVMPGSEWIAYGFAAWLTVGLINNAVGIQGLIASGRELAYGKAASIAALVLTAGYAVLGSRWEALGIICAMLTAEIVFLGMNARAFRRITLAC